MATLQSCVDVQLSLTSISVISEVRFASHQSARLLIWSSLSFETRTIWVMKTDFICYMGSISEAANLYL